MVDQQLLLKSNQPRPERSQGRIPVLLLDTSVTRAYTPRTMLVYCTLELVWRLNYHKLIVYIEIGVIRPNSGADTPEIQSLNSGHLNHPKPVRP